jgi:cell division transport system permease protein
LISFIFNEAMRDLSRAGRVGISAILLIALSLTALGGFWLLSLNLGRAIDQWRDRVRVIVYLKEEPPAGQLDDLMQRIEAVGGIQRLRYVSKAEALRVLKRSLGSEADVADQLPRNPLPASVEVTPDAAVATPEGTRALVGRLVALPEVDEVQGGSQWVDGLAQFRRLFQGMGLVVGAVLSLAAILTVTTATTLVLHLRRDEMEIMRLVGATENVIRWPRLLQGMAQGLVAAIVALATLEVAYALAVPRLEPLLPVTIGLERVTFLSPLQALALIGAGTLLGALGGLMARGRAQA